MKRHETLHLGSPKPRHSGSGRSYRRLSSTSRAKSSAIQGSNNTAPRLPPLDTSDQHVPPRSPLSDQTDGSASATEYFAPFVADPAPQDLGTELGDLGNLDPFLMSSTNWLPPAQPGHVNFDPFNVLLDPTQAWNLSPAVTGAMDVQSGGKPMVVPSNHTPLPSSSDPLSSATLPSQLRKVSSADALTCDSPRSFSSVESSERSSQAPSGEFYIDGGATRLPKGRKRRTSVNSTQGISPGYGSHSSRLTLLSNNLSGHFDHPISFVSGQNHNIMGEVFKQTCTQAQTSFPAFEEDTFLPQAVIDDLVSLAIEHFLPTLPFIHKPKLQSQSSSWILYLALATIGTHYELTVLDERVFSMNEFLRRALAWVEVYTLQVSLRIVN